MPAASDHHRRHLGAIHDTGELTYMNLVHLAGCDGTDPDSLTRVRDRGPAAGHAGHRGAAPVHAGCERVRLRNFGMTIGIRDTRKIDARYNLTEPDVREQGRFADSIGIYPEFIDGYGVLVLPTTGRYLQLPYRVLCTARHRAVCSSPAGPSAVIGSRMPPPAICRAARSPARAPAWPRRSPFGRRKSLRGVDIAAVQAELVRQGVRIS